MVRPFHQLPRYCVMPDTRHGSLAAAWAQRRLLRRVRVLSVLLIGGVTPVVRAQSPLARAKQSGDVVCALRVLDSSIVHFDSVSMYVEPQAVEFAGRRLLIAGSPNYMWIGAGSEAGATVARDSVFGVIRDSRGRWTSVPKPPGIRWFTGVRALARRDGRWDVVFVELPEMYSPSGRDSTIAAWHGVLSAAGWEDLERLPVAPARFIGAMTSTQLVRDGEALTWLASVRGDGVHPLGDVALLRRQAGRWSQSLLGVIPLQVFAYQDADGHPVALIDHLSMRNPGAVHSSRYALTSTPALLGEFLPPTATNRFGRWVDRTSDGTATFGWSEAVPRENVFGWVVRLPGTSPGRDSVGVTDRYLRLRRLDHTPPRADWLFLGILQESGSGGRLDLLRAQGNVLGRVASVAHRFLAPPTILQVSTDTIVLTGPVLRQSTSGARFESLGTTVGFTCRE